MSPIRRAVTFAPLLILTNFSPAVSHDDVGVLYPPIEKVFAIFLWIFQQDFGRLGRLSANFRQIGQIEPFEDVIKNDWCCVCRAHSHPISFATTGFSLFSADFRAENSDSS